MERTLVLVKPDAVEKGYSGAILAKLEATGAKLVAAKMLKIPKAIAEKHYEAHKAKPFFASVVGFITSGPVVAAVFEGENVVATVRKAMGATNPANAAPGTIRKDFAESIEANSVHGSDSTDNAKIEIGFFFSGTELVG